ncbi:hypothetical protein OCT63_18225 [Vibrio sp. RW]|uniref:hypothetical protein n=1 Tax=Vibrio sp. RW TaxID=2998833 RepID=UPI0022CD35B2|nr:hypothetical protein [Vibrio sp. RW]MDA0146166.1 hypothetical protein [Vibrio sp. RW]
MDNNKTSNIFTAAVLVIIMFAIFKQARAEEHPFPYKYNAWDTTSEEGCYHNGEFFHVGEIEAMNKADLDEYMSATGYRASDGYAVMMLCTYDVVPSLGDHPKPGDRTHKWVAYSWYW